MNVMKLPRQQFGTEARKRRRKYLGD